MRRTVLIPLSGLLAGLVTLVPTTPAGAATELDPTYGDEGVATLVAPDPEDPGQVEPAFAFWAAVDGKGRALHSTFDHGLLRLTADGQPDEDFGPDGLVPVPSEVDGGPVETDADGIVVAGSSGERVAVLRLHEDGSVVEEFGDDGLAVASFDTGAHPLDVAVADDGSVVVLGQAWQDEEDRLVLQRFHPDGSSDLDFGTDGVVVADHPAFPTVSGGLALDERGIVYIDNTGYDVDDEAEIVRLREDGTPDASFGGDGRATVPGPASTIEIDPEDGQLVVAGVAAEGLQVWKLHGDGRMDARFGADASIPFDQGSLIWNVAPLGDGRVAAVGDRGNDGVFAAVFDASGNLEEGFGTDGVLWFADHGVVYGGGIGKGTGDRLLVTSQTPQPATGGFPDTLVRAYTTDFAGVAPAVTEVDAYDTSLSVRWEAPEVESDPIRLYHLVALQGDEVVGQSIVAGDVRQASIEGLDPADEAYDIVIQPYDDFGPTTASEPFAVAAAAGELPAPGPAAAVAVTVSPGDGFVEVQWSPPADDGGTTIWGYAVIALRGTDDALMAWRNVAPDVRSAALPGLEDLVAYDIYVVPVTTAGWGEVDPVLYVLPPSSVQPTPATMGWVSVVPTGSNAVVTWGPPVEHGDPVWAVHVVVLEDDEITAWELVRDPQRQVVVPAGPGAEVYTFTQSLYGFGPLTGPVVVD